MTDAENRRIDVTASCRDANYIPKVVLAGSVQKGTDGVPVQIMHNGIKVLADAYYDRFNTEIVKRLRGHHEPQEEKVFHEVLKQIRPGGVMIELGAYWGYYSLWFHKDIAGSINYLIEGNAENLTVGQRNFQLNGFEGHFKWGLVGKAENLTGNPPTITIDGFIRRAALGQVAILHADIQGHEYEMLLGAEASIRRGLFDFIFISSHGFKIHAQCLSLLRKYGYRILCEHTPAESFAVDGLIVATLDREMPTVPITKRQMGFRGWIKSFVCRLMSRVPV